jgi:IS5 family transposase
VAAVCRIPLDQSVPHPATLVKLVRRAGPVTIAQLNTALVGKLAAGKLLRARKLRIDSTVVEADIDHPTDADLLEHAVRKLGGLVRRIKARGAATRTPFRDRGRAAGRRLKQLARTVKRRSGEALAEADRLTRLTGQVAQLAQFTLRGVSAVARNARRALARYRTGGRLRRLAGELDQTRAGLDHRAHPAAAGPDRPAAGRRAQHPGSAGLLGRPGCRPIRKGKPRASRAR